MIAFYKDPSFFDRSLTATASKQGVSLDQYKASFLEGTDALIKNEKDDFTHMALYETNAFIQAPAEISINLLPSEPLPVSSLISLINLHYNHYRYYDPQLGRYITSDPIGLSDGLNTYNYANVNPINYVDSMGMYALNPATGAGGGFAIGGPPGAVVGFVAGVVAVGVTAWGINEAINHYNESASKSDKAEKARERKEYSRVCKAPIPPTGDACTDAKNNLSRLKQCLQLRENFSRKWYNDGEAGHMQEIQNTRTAIRNLEQWIRDNCGEQCE